MDAHHLRDLVAQQLSQAMAGANEQLAQHHRLADMAERAKADAHTNAGATQALQKVMEIIASLDKPENQAADGASGNTG